MRGGYDCITASRRNRAAAGAEVNDRSDYHVAFFSGNDSEPAVKKASSWNSVMVDQ